MTHKILSAGALLLALAVPHMAMAANTASGTYLFRQNEVCQAVQNVTAVTSTSPISLESIDPGGIHLSAGYITLTPSKAGSLKGSFSLVQSSIDGSLLVTGYAGPPVQPATHNLVLTPADAAKPQTGKFELTPGVGLNPGTLKVTESSGSSSFEVFVGGLNSGIFHEIQLFRLETGNKGNEACALSISLSHI